MLRLQITYLTLDDISNLDDSIKKCYGSDLSYFFANDSNILQEKQPICYYLKKRDTVYAYDSINEKIIEPDKKTIIFSRPVLQFNIFNWNKNWDDEKEIEFGYYPQNYDGNIKQEDLEHTDYNFRGMYFCDYNEKIYYRIYKDKNTNDYFLNDYLGTIFKVEPIIWYVDKKKKRLISKYAILSPSSYEEGLKLINDLSFEISSDRFQKYVKKTRKNELKNHIELEERQKMFEQYNKSNEIVEHQPIINDKKTEIKQILDELNKYLDNYYGSFDISSYINKLLSDYNNRINEINSEKDLPMLSLEDNNRESLYNKLICDLSTILNDLKIYNDNLKDYIKMLNIIITCQGKEEIMEKSKSDNQIIDMIYNIKNIVFKFLQDKEMEDKLNKILEEEKKLLLNTLKNFRVNNKNNAVDLLSFDQLLQEFAKRINPYLQELDKKINQKDLKNEIQESYLEIGKCSYHNERNSTITFYLNNLNSLFSEINEKGNHNEIEKAKEIIEETIDYNQGFDDIINNLVRKNVLLNRIVIDICERIKNNNYLFDVNVKMLVKCKK